MPLSVCKGRVFGRGFVADSRDHRFTIESAFRRRRFWRSYWYGDQGDTSECVAYAAAHLLEARPIRQFLQPHGLYGLAKQNDEWVGEDYDGTSVRAAAKVLRMLGHIAEYGWLDSAEAIGSWIAERGPVMLGLDWLAGMLDADDEGWIRARGKTVGGHAVLADGCDLGEAYVRVKNSWGREWGDRGWAKLTFDDLDKLLRRHGEACAAKEVRPAP